MIKITILISLLCIGVYSLTREGSILGFWNSIAYDENEELRSELFEPLTECLFCMSSFWSCFYLMYYYQTPVDMRWFFLGIYILLLGTSILSKGEELITILTKYIYLFGIIMFLVFGVSETIPSTILMLSVAGLNYILSSVLSAIDMQR